jgi:hypothetical protein
MNILVAPLNWGLGHATRCIPLIQNYLKEGHTITIATDGLPAILLREHFPNLRFIELPSYAFRYSHSNSQLGALLYSIPFILTGIIREHKWLKQLLSTENFELVVSDNRFGMWHKNVHSIYITHQLMIKMPRKLRWLESTVHAIHYWFIRKYTECLIPDYAGVPNLSGDLSHRYALPSNARFAGPFSRFDAIQSVPSQQYSTVILISGPEPQRSIFEQQQLQQAATYPPPVLMVRGQPGNTGSISKKDITLVPHLSTQQLANYLTGCSYIVCRSGYSTLMDLESLGCKHKANLIPTPGQTEQEYLAHYHKKSP